MKITQATRFCCVMLLSSQLIPSATVVAKTTSESPQSTVQSSEALTQNSISPKNEQETTTTTTESIAAENQTVPSSSISEESDSTAEKSKEKTYETSNFNKSEKTENTASSEEQTDSPSPQADTRAINLANWGISVNGNIASITDYTGNEQTVVVPALNDLKAANPTAYGACTDVQISKDILQKSARNATHFSISKNGPKVKVSGQDLSQCFSHAKNLSIDLSNLDTSNVTDMSFMFYFCEKLISINITGFDTSNVTSMSAMFSGCSSLPQLDVSHFNMSKVTRVNSMFNNCSNLTNLDVSHFDLSSVTNMGSMFSNCSNLTYLNVSNFNTSKVTVMNSMFNNCSNLINLDVSHFDTSKVQYMFNMFDGCNSLTSLDVSNFNTSKVSNMESMFRNCSNLNSIDLTNFDMTKVTNKNDMFQCTSSTPLLIKATDPILLSYDYHADNRTAPTLKFDANGGTFADGKSEKAYFTSCAIRPENATLEKIKEFAQINEPNQTDAKFLGWVDTSGIPLEKATNFDSELNKIYKAQWKKMFPNIPKGSVKVKEDSITSLGLCYVPKQMTFSSTKLQEKGSQIISFNEGYGFHVGIKDENANQSWQLKVKLQWQTPGLENSYIQTKNTTGTVNKNNNNGTDPVQSSDFQATTDVIGKSNVKIGSQETELMSSAPGTKDGVYDYALEQAELVIPDASIVPPNNYQGTLNWNLVQAP